MDSATPRSTESGKPKDPNRFRMFPNLRAAGEEMRKVNDELELAVLLLMGDLRYPINKDGTVLDTTFFAPLISYHLIRCGWRPDPEKRMIKARRITAKGVVQGAVEWVPVDAPDDPLVNLPTMTMADIERLSPAMRAEALRRMGGPETSDLPDNPGWHVATTIKIEPAPDADDGIGWN